MTMRRDTLEALRGSIKKWEEIVAGTGVDEGYRNCPLCVMFDNYDDPAANHECDGCPVYAKTDVPGCNETPYDEWVLVKGPTRKADTPKRLAAAQRELDFLRSLLPKALTGDQQT